MDTRWSFLKNDHWVIVFKKQNYHQSSIQVHPEIVSDRKHFLFIIISSLEGFYRCTAFLARVSVHSPTEKKRSPKSMIESSLRAPPPFCDFGQHNSEAAAGSAEIAAFSFRLLRTTFFNFSILTKKWFHKVELLEAHSQTVYTSGIYLLGLRPRKASGAARPPLSFRFCYGLRGVLRTLKLTTRIPYVWINSLI